MNDVTITTVKGHDVFEIFALDGHTVVATSHVVFIPTDTYTVKVRGVWRGALPKADALEYLRNLDLTTPLDDSPRRQLLGTTHRWYKDGQGSTIDCNCDQSNGKDHVFTPTCMWDDTSAVEIGAGDYGQPVGPKCTRHATPVGGRR